MEYENKGLNLIRVKYRVKPGFSALLTKINILFHKDLYHINKFYQHQFGEL